LRSADGQPFNAELAQKTLAKQLGSAGMEGIIEDAEATDEATLRLRLGSRAMDRVSVFPLGTYEMYLFRLTQVEFEMIG
jgi:hypothetical protein